MTYMRGAGLVGVGVLAFVVLVLGEIMVARGRTYLLDVDFTIERTVGPQGVGRPLELRVLGDSTVAGVGTDSVDDALPVLLAERVVEHTGRAVHVVGHGVSGARTADVLTEQLPYVDGADVVVILIGSNDVTHVTPPGRVRARTREMLRAAGANGVPVVLGGVPRFLGVGAFSQPLRELVDRWAAVVRGRQRRAASEVPGATFVDIAALASPRFLGRPDAMSSDQFHPSTVGYGFWADALTPAVVAADAGVSVPVLGNPERDTR